MYLMRVGVRVGVGVILVEVSHLTKRNVSPVEISGVYSGANLQPLSPEY